MKWWRMKLKLHTWDEFISSSRSFTDFQVFSYWVGELPETAKLHFASFLYFSKSQYVLCLEESSFKSLPQWLVEFENSNQIKVVLVNLDKLMKDLSVPSFPLGQTLRLSTNVKLMRFLTRNLGTRVQNLLGLGTFIPELNYWFIPHDRAESSLRDWLPYKADVFRILFANYSDATLGIL
jgi:hypothetical protein